MVNENIMMVAGCMLHHPLPCFILFT